MGPPSTNAVATQCKTGVNQSREESESILMLPFRGSQGRPLWITWSSATVFSTCHASTDCPQVFSVETCWVPVNSFWEKQTTRVFSGPRALLSRLPWPSSSLSPWCLGRKETGRFHSTGQGGEQSYGVSNTVRSSVDIHRGLDGESTSMLPASYSVKKYAIWNCIKFIHWFWSIIFSHPLNDEYLLRTRLFPSIWTQSSLCRYFTST